MKSLIKAADVKNLIGTDNKTLYVDTDAIVTFEARDMAEKLGIAIKRTEAGRNESKCSEAAASSECCSGAGTAAIDQSRIAQIVEQVVAATCAGGQCQQDLKVDKDPGGLRLVHGGTVVFEPFNTGNPNHKVQIKELLDIKESPHMSTGFMTIEKTSFDWVLNYEEIDYIVEGVLEFIIDGKKYSGKAGDVFYIPSGASVTFSSPGKVKFFYVTYPANWAELSDYDKK